jgi:signal peptidase I
MSVSAESGRKNRKLLAILGLTGLGVTALLGLCVLLLGVVFRTYYLPAASMAPTLLVHDIVLVNKLAYLASRPREGDIVTFDPPIDSTNRFIKRVIGLPGDTLRIHDGIVYRNGSALAEPYVAEKTGYELEIRNYGIDVDGERLDSSDANIPPRDAWTSPNTVPPNCYFVLGDNRNNSEDSHFWGFAQSGGTFFSGKEAGKGAGGFEKVLSILSPSNRARSIAQ